MTDRELELVKACLWLAIETAPSEAELRELVDQQRHLFEALAQDRPDLADQLRRDYAARRDGLRLTPPSAAAE